ncbi:MAG TPA: hypothetical protein VFR02_06430 [bacterium]|nr:hypothetical protein [bacterium]
MSNETHQHDAPPRPAGWHDPKPLKLPPPTVWPTVIALAVVSMAWGAVTSIYITLGGLIAFVVSIIGWIGELRNDRKN